MTFEEWFEQEYPESIWQPYYMERETMKDIMSTSWEAGYRQAYFECTPNWG
jgi:hypothetical protein